MHLLRTLPKDMLRALDKFVRSPYLVTHPGVVQLFEYLRDHQHNDKAGDQSRKACVMHKLFNESDHWTENTSKPSTKVSGLAGC